MEGPVGRADPMNRDLPMDGGTLGHKPAVGDRRAHQGGGVPAQTARLPGGEQGRGVSRTLGRGSKRLAMFCPHRCSLRGGIYPSSSKPSRMPVDCPTSMRWPSGSRM